MFVVLSLHKKTLRINWSYFSMVGRWDVCPGLAEIRKYLFDRLIGPNRFIIISVGKLIKNDFI